MNILRIAKNLTLALLLFLYALLSVLYWNIEPRRGGPAQWGLQFHVLLGLCASLTLAMVFFESRPYARLLFLPKLLFAVFFSNTAAVVSLTVGQFWGLESVFFAAQAAEFALFVPARVALVLSLVLGALTAGIALYTSSLDTGFPQITWQVLAPAGLVLLVVTLLSLLVRWLVLRIEALDRQRLRLETAVAQLIDANIGFQAYATSAAERSVLLERKRISRDIHDTAIHTMTNILMLAESVHDNLSPAQTKASRCLDLIILEGKEAIRDTRESLRELRLFDDPTRRGVKALQHLVSVFAEATGLEINISYGNLPWELEDEMDRAVYRIVQESLSNAFRHGKASKIAISFWIRELADDRELVVHVFDNGKGTPSITKGIGLQGMEERLLPWEGRVEAGNVEGGFSVSVVIPIRQTSGSRL
ncbi:MAG: histidine kinase [Spirochaetales bacterium]